MSLLESTLEDASTQNKIAGDILQQAWDYCDAAREIVETVQPIDSPPSFLERVWPAYLNAIQASEFYFSTSELLVISERQSINVAVFSAIGSSLR